MRKEIQELVEKLERTIGSEVKVGLYIYPIKKLSERKIIGLAWFNNIISDEEEERLSNGCSDKGNLYSALNDIVNCDVINGGDLN